MTRRRYWGIGLIALAMLMAHLIVLSVDSNRPVSAMALHGLLMFGWSLIINFALRGEIAVVKSTAEIAVVLHVIMTGGLMLFGGQGAAVTTVLGTLPLSVFLLGVSGAVWAFVLAIASWRKAQFDRLYTIDPSEALMGFGGAEGHAQPGIVQSVQSALPRFAAYARTNLRNILPFRRRVAVPAMADAPLAIPYYPSAREMGILRLSGGETSDPSYLRAPTAPPVTTPAPPKAAPAPAELEPFVLRDPIPQPAAAEAPEPVATEIPQAPKPMAKPTDSKRALERKAVRQAITAHTDEPWNRGLPRKRVKDLKSALTANTTIEAVAAINSTRSYQARLGIRNRGRFVNSSGKKVGFAGLDQLKELVRAELDKAS